ncbi:MAG: hypothetical protein KDE19_08065, partial [Caldilineaceae bacterium]|nr:hypothetical protein [Caldilineaceae bacterium]
MEIIGQPVALLAAPAAESSLSSLSSPVASTTAAPVWNEDATADVGIPELIGPDNGTISTGRTDPPIGVPRLSWKPVEGADFYYLQISQTAGFAEVTAWAKTYATTYITYGALRDGTYYWRVRAGIGRNEYGEYSEARTFTKDWTDGGTFVPELLSPPDGAERIAFTNDDFTWQPFQGAAQYLFEISS